MKTKILFLFSIILAVYLSGCMFKKNVMKDDADNIEEAYIASTNGENFLIMKEVVFQATSKSSKQGIRMTSGYNEYRLTSYELETGKISKRIELGGQDDEYMYFIGATDGKIWYYSKDEKIGLHARNPKTLDIIVSKNDIEKVNPFLKDNFPKVKWYELRKYFGFDLAKKVPMISDNSGFVYLLNPDNYGTEKVSASIKNFEYEKTMSTTSINVTKDDYMSLTGDPRKHINFKSKNFDQPDFLKGEFLQSSNSLNVKEVFPEYLTPLYNEIEKKQRYIDSVKELGEQMKDETDKYKQRSYEYLKNNIKYAEDDIDRKYKEINDLSTSRFNTIISKDKGVFVIHATTASDTSKVIISKVTFDADNKTINLAWTTLLDNIFTEPDKVYEKGGFDYVFSKGSPNLRTKRAILAGNKIIFISMLRAVCIDTNTGNVLWNINI
ncbi:MAG: PA2928 family protein [Ignavibacteria bacterium]|nr:PA2928 family protein [Ignavibacteria bacterium]